MQLVIKNNNKKEKLILDNLEIIILTINEL